jgi:hypothetical protein
MPAGARWRAGLVALLPAAAQGLVHAASTGGTRGVFQADLTAMVAIVAIAAFAVRGGRRGLWLVPGAAALSVLVHLGIAGGDGALSHGLLLLAAGVAAGGIAAVGRAIGAGRTASGAAAGGVLWLAMTGLFWAGEVAEVLPEPKRRAFRQAVLHADLATASAYGVAGFDRMHDGPVYRRVALASTLVGRPSAPHTAGAWLAVGLAFCGAAWWLGAGREAPHDDS